MIYTARAATAAAVAALLLTTLAAPAAAAADPSPITVTASSHTIDFGSAIRFSLDATSSAASIMEIQARFKPIGPKTVWSYTYARFTPAATVHARFEIRTRDGTYYPPGVQFDVYSLITDAAGNSLQTPTERIHYLDPDLQWQHTTKGAVTALTYDVSPSTIQALLDAAAERLPVIMETTGVQSPGEYTAVLFASPAEAEAHFPPVSETTRREHTFAGFATPQYALFILARPRPDMFVHELTHLVVAQATTSPLATPVPAWLNEGLAVFFETGSSNTSRQSIQKAAQRGELLPLHTMNSIPGRPADIYTFYPQAGAFVGYLIERFGSTAIADIFRRLDSGQPVAAAVEAAIGVPLDSLDAHFRTRMGAPATPAPAPTPTPAPAPTAQTPERTAETAALTPAPAPTAAAEPGGSASAARDVNDTLLYLAIAAGAGLLIGGAVAHLRGRRR
ncbi:MAG: hypothetical protein FJ313_03265, partial [Gemmatimonadetes bacterium]|nr:hypothetical protein [Gemmatimonadota bacterium]